MEAPIFEGYEEFVERFVFRENGALTIPKRVREFAYALQIDIEIVSTDGNDYKNTKSTPAYGFYGYAVIVLRDHSEIQIPINQPRQVLYYGRVPEAFTNWYSLYLSFVDIATQAAIAEGLLVPIGEAVGLSIGYSEPFCPTAPPWQELPIREVYIKCRRSIQFRTGVTWTEPIASTYGECSYTGGSQQTDAPSDSGLPPSGSQPQTAPNSNFPFAGLEPPSTGEELGDFFNLKQSDLDKPNSENEPNLDNIIYWVRVVLRVKRSFFDGGCGTTRVQISWIQVLPTTSIVSVTPVGAMVSNGCDGMYPDGGWNILLSGGEPFGIGNSDSNPQVSLGSGTSKPPDELYFE